MKMFVLDFCVFSILISWVAGNHIQLTKCKHQGDMFDCSRLALTRVPRDIPQTIRVLYLYANRINILRSHSFQFLYNLTHLRLDQNNMQEIQRDAFVGLTSLVNLALVANTLYSIPEGSFNSLVSLTDLLIQENKFKGTHMTNLAKEISKLGSLQTLGIDITPGFHFHRDFERLTKLNTLNVCGNDVFGNFTKDTFQHLDMTPVTNLSLNNVMSIEKETFFPLSRLTSLNIHISGNVPNNPVDEIFKSFSVFKGLNITHIGLYGNRFNNAFTLERAHLKYVEDICLRQFILQSMSIRYVNPWAFQLFSMRSNCLEYFEMSDNIIFDENGSVLLINIRHFKRLRVFRYNSFRQLRRSKRSNAFSSSYNFTLVLTNTLEELYIGNSMQVDSLNNVIVVNGLNLRVLSAPYNYIGDCIGYSMGMENLKYFDISGWTCKQLSEKFLTGFPNLEIFIARNSYIGIGFKNNPKTSGFFSNNKRLRTIDLSNNSINLIPADLFNQPIGNLKQVNLSWNKITALPRFSSNFKLMKTIDLTYNLFTSFTDNELKVVSEIGPVIFHLLGNPLQCSCKTLSFMKWMSNTANVADFVLIKCILEDGSRKAISVVIEDLHSFEIKCKSKFWLIFSVTLTSVFILSIIFTIIYFRYKFAIEYILLKWKMWWNGYKPLQRDYTYDAFISHSHHDSIWVKLFYDKLSDMGFNVCVDAKDFIAGKGIAENVMNAIDSSRKVIFIITRNFLNSNWGSFEIEMTRMHAFQEGREEMVIIVLKDNIRSDEMPRILKSMWYKINCIRWPEDDNEVPFHTKEIFFEKMNHALKGNTTDGEIVERNVCV